MRGTVSSSDKLQSLACVIHGIARHARAKTSEHRSAHILVSKMDGGWSVWGGKIGRCVKLRLPEVNSEAREIPFLDTNTHLLDSRPSIPTGPRAWIRPVSVIGGRVQRTIRAIALVPHSAVEGTRTCTNSDLSAQSEAITVSKACAG